MPMSGMSAIKAFMEKDSVREKVTSREMIDFKHACTDREWEEFSAGAAAAIGETLSSAAPAIQK